MLDVYIKHVVEHFWRSRRTLDLVLPYRYIVWHTMWYWSSCVCHMAIESCTWPIKCVHRCYLIFCTAEW